MIEKVDGLFEPVKKPTAHPPAQTTTSLVGLERLGEIKQTNNKEKIDFHYKCLHYQFIFTVIFFTMNINSEEAPPSSCSLTIRIFSQEKRAS